MIQQTLKSSTKIQHLRNLLKIQRYVNILELRGEIKD